MKGNANKHDDKLAVLKEDEMLVVCCECGCTIKVVKAMGSGSRVSHGYCEGCYRQALEELDLFMGGVERPSADMVSQG